jgi:hypothetical protein
MNIDLFNEPLQVAAADSLRRAASVARALAKRSGLPLVVWKDGKVTYLPTLTTKRRKKRAALAKK